MMVPEKSDPRISPFLVTNSSETVLAWKDMSYVIMLNIMGHKSQPKIFLALVCDILIIMKTVYI